MSAEESKKKNKGGSQLAWIHRTEVVLKELKRGGMVEITPGNRYRITAAGRQSISNDEPSETSDTIAAVNVSSTERMSELLNEIMRMTRSVDNVIVLKRTTIPNRIEIKPILLRLMRADRTYSRQECRDHVRAILNLSDDVLDEKYPSGIVKWSNEVDWAINELTRDGLIASKHRNQHRLTEAGRNFLSSLTN